MTMLEVVLAITLLTSAIFAGVSTFDAVSRSTVALSNRTRAVDLAEREIETIRSFTYARIGLSPSAPGFTASFEHAATVRVDDPVVAPASVVTDGGRRFDVERHITWVDVDDPKGATTLGAYKRITVIVSWTGTSRASVRLDSGVSPYAQAEACARRDTDGSPGEVTGVVDHFYAGRADVAAGATVLAVSDSGRGATGASVGDLLLIVQMGGARAGTYEYARAASGWSGDRLAVTGDGVAGGLLNAYSAADGFQVVRVPTYGSTSLGNVGTVPWDGSTGGVLAIDVAGDARLTGTIDASWSGLTDSGAPEVSPTPGSLLPGRGDKAGGGLVMLRASSVSGGGTITADGGGGGRVVVETESGGLDALSVVARAAGAGPVGAALLSSPAGSVDLSSSSGAPGTAVTDAHLADLVGTTLGVGCLPAVSIDKRAASSDVVNDDGGTATYTLTATAAKEHPTVTGVVLSDPLPAGFTFLTTGSVVTSGGAARDASSDPIVGDTEPQWGSFTLTPGSSVSVTFTAAVSAQVAPGPVGNSAVVRYATQRGAAVGRYDDAMGGADDVVVRPFACQTPWTDPAPKGGLVGVVNTYYPGAATVATGATSLRVGTPTGATTPIAAGDMLLVIQMQGATIDPSDGDDYGDGPGGATRSGAVSLNGVGNYEYAVATSAVVGGVVSVSASGVSGGLVNGYDSGPVSANQAASTFQVVRVPSYPDTALVSLRAAPWDGSVGGVLAVDVAGRLDLANGTASVTGDGFRGAIATARTATTNAVVDNTGASGGPKGEGIAGGLGLTPSGSFGTGAPGTAGGGGGVSAGGGGGANTAVGGDGGRSTGDAGGVGGSLTSPASSRVLLGGGGGSTQLDVGQKAAVAGGRGGGAVFLRSTTISGTGIVTADGSDGSPGPIVAGTGTSTEIGGGGGGAGGTVVVSSTTTSLPGLTVSARGGSGGAVAVGSSVAGGGGGGAGGRVVTTSAVTASTDGGAAGEPITGTRRSGVGRSGSIATVPMSSVVGSRLGQGCRPILSVTSATTTPTVLRVPGSTARWTVTVANLTGHLDAKSIAVTDLLPSGFTLSSTDAVTTSGGATRPTVGDPSAGSAAPTWSSFDLPGGSTVTITFTASVSGASVGTVGNTVVGGASYFGSVIASKSSDTDSSADDVSVIDATSQVFAHSMIDRLTASSPTTTTDELWASDGATVTTGPFGTSASAGRYVDVDFTSPAVPTSSGTSALRPQPTGVSVNLDLAATTAPATACVIVEVGSATTATFHTLVATPVCVTGTTSTPTAVTLPSRTWTGAELADLRVRLLGTSSAGLGIVLDRVGVTVSWASSTWQLQPTRVIDASTGTPGSPTWARAVADDTTGFITGGSGNLPTTFSASSYLDLRVPGSIPAGSTIASASATMRWKADAGATACWYVDLRSGGARIGGVGTAASPTCRANANSAATDHLALPPLTAAQLDDLTARVYFRTSSGSATSITIDRFAVDVVWSHS